MKTNPTSLRQCGRGPGMSAWVAAVILAFCAAGEAREGPGLDVREPTTRPETPQERRLREEREGNAAREHFQAVANEARMLAALPADAAVDRINQADVRGEVLAFLITYIGNKVADVVYDAAKEKLAAHRAEMEALNAEKAKQMIKEIQHRDRDRYQREKNESGEWRGLSPDRQAEMLDRILGRE